MPELESASSLCGKGVWLTHSYDLQRAMEMATSVDAQYLIIKVGHGPLYFPETTQSLGKRVRNLGLSPLAWIHVTAYASQDVLKAIAESLALGYEQAILFLDDTLITGSEVQPLVVAIDNAEIPLDRLCLATPPLSHIPDRGVLEALAPLCQGGWMPLCFERWGDSPERVIDRDVYQALGDLSPLWGTTPDVYPVLTPVHTDPADPRAQDTSFLPEEFIPWIEAVIQHGVDFFSVYHVAGIEKALWPLVQSVKITCMRAAKVEASAEPDTDPNSVVPQPVYITAGTSDTVWGIITRYGLTKERFWEWNGHLWDSRGLPRDTDYLQEGWRIRVK